MRHQIQSRSDRRRFLKLLGLSASASLLAACAQIQAPAPTAAPKSGAAPTGAVKSSSAPTRGGTLTIGKTADITGFDPYGLHPGNFPMLNAIWNVPVRLDQRLSPQAELAEGWDLAPDGSSLTLKMRHGVKFHSGRELDAQDVEFSVDWAKDERRAANIRPLALTIERVDTPAKMTAVLRFARPNPGIFDTLDLLYILDRESAGKDGAPPIGTGPFKLDQWLPGNELRLTRFADYWRQGRPYVDQIVQRVIPDAASLSINLESGGIDLAERVQVTEFARLKANPALQGGTAAEGASLFNVLLSLKQQPLEDPRVRQAVAFAINRQRFAATVLEGTVAAACLPYPANSLGYDDDQAQRCTYDPERARQLLAEAGHGGGFDVVLTTSSQVASELPKLAQIVQADLGAVGIRVRIEDVEQATWQTRSSRGDYGMMTHTYGRAHKDPTSLFGATIVWRSRDNPTGYADPDYARLLGEAGSIQDPARRKTLYRDVNELILRDNWVIPVAPNPRPWLARANVNGIGFSLDGMLLLDEISVAP